MVPIRYANGSIRATDIKPEDVGRYQPSLSVHSVTGDDQLILPGSDNLSRFCTASSGPEGFF